MKKILSLILSFSIMMVTGITGDASIKANGTVTELYYDTGTKVNVNTQPIQDILTLSDYEKVESISLKTSGYQNMNAGSYEITKPCVVYMGAIIKNSENIGGAYNYQIKLGGAEKANQWNDDKDWTSGSVPGNEYNGGDFEYVKYEITQDMIDAQGGTYTLLSGIRGENFTNLSFAALGQTLSGDSFIRIYYTKQGNIVKKESKDVSANYSPNKVDTYSVNISWGSMEFKYTPDNHTWNAEKLEYDDSKTGKWSCDTDANKITVENRSNKEVKAGFSYTSSTGFETVNGTFSEGSTPITSLMIPSADTGTINTLGQAQSKSAYLNLTSTDFNGKALQNTRIGTVTVRITEGN
ncbi:hypothetical protein [[Eubacterium] hominis]|uniref:hypothetical protein n=1 Tax=[Eubacterium] hominis TaxID=2764325 RepID=UPI003A4DA86B